MKKVILLLVLCALVACQKKSEKVDFVKYDESSAIENSQRHENPRMQFKLLQSHTLDMNEVFAPFENDLAYFSDTDYLNLAPYILEKDIPTIQEAVKNRVLSYEKIVLFYLYRIRKFESDSTKTLHSIISLNPNIVQEAREKDRSPREHDSFSLYGLPILLKDNINTQGMPTTAGAIALLDNKETEDAFIVKKLKENGALILGKANLSEWAYYFCAGCPLGYSAVGGQTLNPYGRKVFETGGSSSGSGVSVAANYAVAAVGTETSGSILSPSSKNSVVGLKPTIGLLSRTGIVPISSTLDTPGPMTKFLIDNAIFLQAMLGEDPQDISTQGNSSEIDFVKNLKKSSIAGKRLGAMNSLKNDSLYVNAITKMKNAGAEIIWFDPLRIQRNGFLTLLTADMKKDLPAYLKDHSDADVSIKNVADVVVFNRQDSLNRAPYGQQHFEAIMIDTTSEDHLNTVKSELELNGRQFFDKPMDSLKLDAILSINNYHASFAAVAKYPCLTVSMGYDNNGEPKNITFIAKQFEERKLLELGMAFEKLSTARRMPHIYR